MTTSSIFITIILNGIIATLFIDIYAFIIKKIFHINSLNYNFLGRWILNFFKGRFLHTTIFNTPTIHGERIIGWISHYLIGILFSWLFIIIIGESWLLSPKPLPAIIFGISTIIFPFIIMQPCFGFGLAGSKLPSPKFARLKSLSVHVLFGIGLYLSTKFT